MNYQPYLDFATSLAYQTGRLTLRYFNTGVQVDRKENHDPVTLADREAEKCIRAEIEKKYPGHAIVGEEYGVSETGHAFRWIIDPIDGTETFIHGVPLYGVLIGLEIEGEIKAGVSYLPGLDEMLCAAEGTGCWWNGRRAQVSALNTFADALVVTYDLLHLNRRAPELAGKLSERGALLRTWGDAYAYLLVATGRAEVALDPEMKIYDAAPYPVIFQEAGGFFGSWKGEEGHDHGEGLACNTAIRPQILEMMRGL